MANNQLLANDPLLKNFKYPPNFKLNLHQEKGVIWIREREMDEEIKGGILADDPGLGKTYQILISILLRSLRKNLIIVPTSILKQWINAIKFILPKKKILIYHRNYQLQFKNHDFDICLTTYGMISSIKCTNYNELSRFEWDRIILDEGHLIRNKNTKLFKNCIGLSKISKIKWILTGTPIQNKETDIISLITFLGINCYRKDLFNNIEKYILRRTKQILLQQNLLNDFSIENHCVYFETKEEQEIYLKIESELIDDLMIIEGNEDIEFSQCLLEVYLRLRQCCIHPNIALKGILNKFNNDYLLKLDFSELRLSSKISALIKDISKTNEYSLVFCHFKSEMEIISNFLKKKGIQSEIFDGSLNIKERNKILSKFDGEKIKKIKTRIGTNKFIIKDNKPRVLIIQIKAGGVGLNLQQFSEVYIVSPDWNPSNEIQAISRSHRIGQQKKVKVHKYTLRINNNFIQNESDKIKTIDERILSKQFDKRELMVSTLNDDSLKFNESFHEEKNSNIIDILGF